MKRQEKNEIYSIRKFKVGVGSALIGLSFLGATGLVNDVPVLGDMFGFETAHADQNSYSVPVYKDGNYIGQGEVWGAAGGLTYRGNVPQGYRIGSVSSSAVYLVKETTNGGSSFDTIGRDSTSYAPTKPDREYTEPESVITYEVTYEADDSKPVGQRYTKTEGRNGAKRAYVDHVRTSGSSIATLVNGVEIIREPVNSVIAIGTAPTVTKTPINFKTVYEKDATRDKGQPNVTKTEGMNGAIVSTVRHTVNSSTGDVTDLPATESKTEPTNKVVKVAAKDKVVYSKKGNDVIKSTTVYTVNPDNGTITENTTEEIFKANGAKDTVATTPIPSPKRYEKDATREKGQPNIETKGVEGVSSVTTTYTVNPQTGATTGTAGQPVVTTQPTETVIKVAAKDKVVTKEIPSPVKYEADNSKDYGTPNAETKGKPGQETTTTVYTVDPKTGDVTDKSTTTRTEPTGTVIKVGTKPKVVTRTDDQGRKVTDTTTYTVDPTTGKVTPTTKTTYGDKANTVEKKVIPSTVRYEKDATREKGQPNITNKGKDGEDQITTTYKVDPTSGKVNQNVGQPVRTVQPTETVVKVAAKDKVEVVPRDGKKFKVTTTYNVDPKTGEITSKTSEVELPKETDADDVDANRKLPDKVETIKPEVVYEKDATRDKGAENITIQGKDGQKVTTVTKEKDPQTGKLVEKLGEPKITPATNTVVKVAAKDKVETKEIPSKVRYVGDESKDNGSEPVRKEGKKGKEVTTTVYTVNPKTGEITESKKTERTEEPTETVVTIGTKPKVEPFMKDGKPYERVTTYTVNPETGEVTPKVTEREVPANSKVEPIKPEVVYEKDATREKGAENITVAGKDGKKVTPVTIVKDPVTGKDVEKFGEPVITPATNTVVKVAAKDKVETKEIPAKVRYVGDETKDKGSEPVRTEGKKGKEVTTTVYTVNPKTGEITEQTSTKRTEEPTETVVKVGAKSKVETIRKNGDTIERTTKYKVNTETGEITEEVIDKLIASNGNGIKPPVVENNDFNGGVNGDADGSALINEKPEFDLSTLKNADLGTGLNDFGPKKDTKKDDLQFIPVNDSKDNNSDNGFKRSEKPASEKSVSQLPNTAGGNNMAINALGALTLTSVLGLAAVKRKKEEK